LNFKAASQITEQGGELGVASVIAVQDVNVGLVVGDEDDVGVGEKLAVHE
jgi:hypothetical protein